MREEADIYRCSVRIPMTEKMRILLRRKANRAGKPVTEYVRDQLGLEISRAQRYVNRAR